MGVDESWAIFEVVDQHHDGKFGFAIYCCVYGDDEAWARFIERLTAHVHAWLDRDKVGRDIQDRYTWDIMDDKAEFEGATKDQVRKHFNQWVESVNGSRVHTRYAHCIYVDQEVIDSVLEGGEPGSWASEDVHDPRAFVKILDWQFEQDEDDEDDGEEPVEGCTLEDVGWTKVAAYALVSQVYALLMDSGWYAVYWRPPTVACG